MTRDPAVRRIISRAAANLVAVAAISSIFGLKAYIDGTARSAALASTAGSLAYTVTNTDYDPYLTEQP